jgi:class 3 adenylate cyclase
MEIADAIEEFLTGTRPAATVDRVLATVLFTDIVGSTEKAAALGDHRWRDLLEIHHSTIRRNLGRFRGHEVKTTGDGILATFDGPARGVRCACTIADEIKSLGIDVRAGLHTGECEIMDHDVGGIAVHIGARVASLAGAGEVLVSSTVKDLVAGSGLRFSDRGSQNLKGVPGEWHIYDHALLQAVVRKPEGGLQSALDRLVTAGLLFRQGVPPHASYLFIRALAAPCPGRARGVRGSWRRGVPSICRRTATDTNSTTGHSRYARKTVFSIAMPA